MLLLPRHSGFDHSKDNILWENLRDCCYISLYKIRWLACYDSRDKSDTVIVLIALYDDRCRQKSDIYMLVTYTMTMVLKP